MIHISKFIDKIKLADTKSSNQFIMTIHEAKGLHNDITKLLLSLHELSNNTKEEITNVEIISPDW